MITIITIPPTNLVWELGLVLWVLIGWQFTLAECVRTEARVVADRLRRLGWLLPTATAGVWEFAPGSHAGPVGHGDQYLELRAALAARPSLDASVCLLSALAAQGLSDRAPDRLEVAVPRSRGVPMDCVAPPAWWSSRRTLRRSGRRECQSTSRPPSWSTSQLARPT